MDAIRQLTVKPAKSQSSSHGFTLVEVMVAILILTVGLLGLLQLTITASEQNLRNAFRTEAVQISEERLLSRRVQPFDNITGGLKSQQVASRLRGFTMNYTVERSYTDLSPDSKQLIVTVRWNYKNNPYSHEVRSVRTR